MANSIGSLIQAKEAARPQPQPYAVGDSLPITKIRTDGGTQARAGLDEVTVGEYTHAMEDGAAFPLIVVYHDGADHWLADGFHRVAAATRAGLTALRAEVRQGTRRDAVLHACGANASHGLRRTTEDKRRAIATLLRDEEWRQWSDRKIADACGVSDKTVASVRRDLSAEFPQIQTRTVERNGTTYQMTPAAPREGPETPESRDADGPWFWAGKSAVHPTAHCWHRNTVTGGYVSACGVAASIQPTHGGKGFHCSVCDKHADRREIVPIPGAEAAPAEPIPPVRYQQLPPPIELPIPTADDAADDAAIGASIRALAEPLGLMMIWEDDRVVLYWPDEADDIEQMDLLSYGAALEWLKWEAVGIKKDRDAASQVDPAHVTAVEEQIEAGDREPQLMPTLTELPASESASTYKVKEERDAGRLLRARTLIAAGEHGAARVVLGQVEVSTYARDQLLREIPAGREITLALTFDECTALLREARMFSGSELTKRLPTIGQTLVLMIEAIKGAST